ncbi:nitroreductase/quinone reductase family protein [Rhodococcoides corynebacterioides]|uniref:nitroreductase/quinone reductase family protein n=1 Tax=Rhodococcoides corynebacterioides TaxID=53972 RepID=UPI001C9BA4C4|nr:nitroreductase/quinone reductase family protein [Rhodococcus corynebacterioides]MBY6363574.1 nitroreductase family deazaflavin-dependent oxidoreductase [Rhodococcus corynebacterioides]
MTLFQTVSGAANTLVRPLMRMPGLGSLLGRGLATVTYTGRKSGRRISLPVAYSRRGDVVTVTVVAPSQKSWWRNFRPDPAPVTLDIAGVEHRGTAQATESTTGAVTVTITLES